MTRLRRAAPAALLATLSLLHSAPAMAQETSPGAVPLAALKRFDSWVGRWAGSGWSFDRAGHRMDFTLAETVTRKVGGTVLLIEGHGHATADSTITTHDGLVVVYYDERAGTYRWNGHEAGLGPVDAAAVPVDGGLVWSIPAGAGGQRVRFTIRFDEQHWHEVGEIGTDGTGWGTFMEMELDRVPNGASPA